MTEKEIILAKIMTDWDQACPDASAEGRQVAQDLFDLGLSALSDEQLDDFKKRWFDG